ncbi:MAG TPA: 30S ribosomal protein S20 [Acidimicrobiia bacterium]|nr:30S ribosomal protein S20 [Acidimicrobiia bacterium]
MANIKSQIKRNRQNEKRRLRNKAIKSRIKTSLRKVREAAAAGEPIEELLREAQKEIDVAAAKGILHPNTAARRKSRLVAELNRR